MPTHLGTLEKRRLIDALANRSKRERPDRDPATYRRRLAGHNVLELRRLWWRGK